MGAHRPRDAKSDYWLRRKFPLPSHFSKKLGKGKNPIFPPLTEEILKIAQRYLKIHNLTLRALRHR